MSSAGRSKSKPSESKTSTKAPSGTKVVVKSGTLGRTQAKKRIGVTRSPAVAPSTTAVQFPPEQYDLPVTFDQSGQILTLRQMLEPGSSAMPLSSLDPEKLAELATQRIAAQPDFEIAMISAGRVNKARALKEIAAQTDVGQLLVEIEQRVIKLVLDRAMPGYYYQRVLPVEPEQRVFQNVLNHATP